MAAAAVVGEAPAAARSQPPVASGLGRRGRIAPDPSPSLPSSGREVRSVLRSERACARAHHTSAAFSARSRSRSSGSRPSWRSSAAPSSHAPSIPPGVGALSGSRKRCAPRRPRPLLGNECLPNGCSCPSVRAVNRSNLLRVQPLGDLLQRRPLPEQLVDLLPPYVVTLVAEPMREPDVVGGEVTSVHLESRIVVGRRRPFGMRRSRLEVATTPEAVAVGHLATHVDDLAIAGELPEDSADS